MVYLFFFRWLHLSLVVFMWIHSFSHILLMCLFVYLFIFLLSFNVDIIVIAVFTVVGEDTGNDGGFGYSNFISFGWATPNAMNQ